MKHNYGTDELKAAHKIAAKQIRIDELHTTKYLSAFLDALPEMPDRHNAQLITHSDVQPDDRVLITDIHGNRYEVTVTSKGNTDIAWEGDYIVTDQIERIQLLDRPIQYPNPAEYPVILVSAGHRVAYDRPEPHVWDGEAYSALDRALSYLMPTQITEWEPAKVVEDDR